MLANKESLRTVSTGIGNFSTEFYKLLAENATGNTICSPISAAVVLSMAMYGARGDTESQLRAALHLPTDDTVAKSGVQSLIDSLNNVKGVELRMANKIFTKYGFQVNEEFKVVTETHFRSITESLDFDKSIEASQVINNWCETTTNNRIKDVVQSDDLKDAALVLINAVYFKGQWAEKFDPSSTSSQPFYVNANTVKDVPMMYKSDKFNYGRISELDDAEYIELPYVSTDPKNGLSMFIILPNEVNGLETVEANLHKINFTELQGSTHKVDVWLPKFKIESKFDLKDILQKMGIRGIFQDNANFNRISESTQLKVSKIIQKAFIEVNEEGSEAAAVTGLQIMLMCMPPTFMANRPFFCTIVARDSGIQLFNARVVDPTA